MEDVTDFGTVRPGSSDGLAQQGQIERDSNHNGIKCGTSTVGLIIKAGVKLRPGAGMHRLDQGDLDRPPDVVLDPVRYVMPL